MENNNLEISPHIRPIPTYITGREPYTGLASIPDDFSSPENSPLKDYVRIFMTYRWLIASVSVIVLAAALLYSFLATPMYTAEAKLKIGTYSPMLPGAGVEDILRQQTREQDYLQTQVELLSSLTLADKVLSEGGIEAELKNYLARKTGLFSVFSPLRSLFTAKVKEKKTSSSEYRFPLATLHSYPRLISIVPVRKTSLVKVSVSTADPEPRLSELT